MQRFGGGRISFPVEPREDHYVAIVVGRKNFAKLCELYGGIGPTHIPAQRDYVKRRRRIREIRSMYQAGAKKPEIAQHFGTSLRFVQLACSDRYAGLDRSSGAPETVLHGGGNRAFLRCNKDLTCDRPMDATPQPTNEPPYAVDLTGIELEQVVRIVHALRFAAPLIQKKVADQGLSLDQAAFLVGHALMPVLEEVGFIAPPEIPTQGAPAELFQQVSESLPIAGLPLLMQ